MPLTHKQQDKMFAGKAKPHARAAWLLGLESRYGRALTAAEVLEEARDPDSPAHYIWEKPDDEAAYAWRLSEAGRFITSVRVETIVYERMINAVAYMHPPEMNSPRKPGYVAVRHVTDAVRQQTAMEAAAATVNASYERGLGIAAQWEREDEYREMVKQALGF